MRTVVNLLTSPFDGDGEQNPRRRSELPQHRVQNYRYNKEGASFCTNVPAASLYFGHRRMRTYDLFQRDIPSFSFGDAGSDYQGFFLWDSS